MIKKLLIANRGEIAVRIIQACMELDIKTVAVYSQADKNALHVRMADEAYCVGGNSSQSSYLNSLNIINAAALTNCDAIHPGYGFLAENASFAKLCEESNIIFVGPSSESISKMGNKDVARRTMEESNVPIVPGSDGIVETPEMGVEIARKIGYPVIIKAAAGGGGKGIRVARSEEELIKGIVITQQEALVAFGSPDVYMEKYIEDFRHVEIQVLADTFGNTIHLGERDCSIQRRLQKLIEETPSPAIDTKMREKMGLAAVTAAQAVNYVGAGTVEFIYDYKKNKFYFMEMNTRIQVEHPVTEMVTGVDLIKEQINIAAGKKMSVTQNEINFTGWSIECRINAEDSERDFRPSPGCVNVYIPPGGMGVRVDSGVYQGYTIPPFYDSMVAKVIVHGTTREEAIARMKRALNEFVIEGVATTIPFHLKLLENETFKSGDYHTKFLEQEFLNF